MKVLILGAGAVGSYYGGRLAQAGHDVILLGRRAHVEAIQASGLVIDSRITGRQVVCLRAAERAESNEKPDLVLVTVKSYDTEESARPFREVVDERTTILSLQNGIDNHEIASRVLGRPVYPSVIYVGVRITAPGVVEHVTRGEITLPEKLAPLVDVFQSAGILAKTSDNILGMVWNKLLLNASCNALGMIAGCSFGALAASPAAREVIAGAVNEIVRIAAARDIRLPVADPVEQVFKMAESLGPGLSSMLQDHRAGKRTEIEALNGVIVRLGKEHGIPTPYNATLYAAGVLMEEIKFPS
ncbi:MAG: ketopantoate reductase family protein [Acidobacteria bacterium]|nr:ketopantoate reductase family protein [Acidobacteriota bacterium]